MTYILSLQFGRIWDCLEVIVSSDEKSKWWKRAYWNFKQIYISSSGEGADFRDTMKKTHELSNKNVIMETKEENVIKIRTLLENPLLWVYILRPLSQSIFILFKSKHNFILTFPPRSIFLNHFSKLANKNLIEINHLLHFWVSHPSHKTKTMTLFPGALSRKCACIVIN